jgi:hypothetical protein
MARFAPVVPLAVAQALKNANLLGTYHLLLAHDTLAHPEAYREMYGAHALPVSDDPKCVIMDNSVVELGEAMPFEQVQAAADIVDADFIVAADAFLEAEITIRRAELFRQASRAYVGRMHPVRRLLRLVRRLRGDQHPTMLDGTTGFPDPPRTAHLAALPSTLRPDSSVGLVGQLVRRSHDCTSPRRRWH